MRRAKTQLFSRRGSTAAAHHNNNNHHSPPSGPDHSHSHAQSHAYDPHTPSAKGRDRDDHRIFDGSRSRIGLSMGLKGILAGSAARRAAAADQHHAPPRRPDDDVFKWGRKKREVFGTRAGVFQDGITNSVISTDAPPLRYSNSNIRVAGWLSKRGKRLGSRIDRFFELHGSILSNARSQNSRPTWSVNVRGSKVLSGPGREIIFKVNKTFTSFYAPNEELHEKWIKALQAVSGNVTDYYDFGKLIGRGAYSEVFIARDKARNELCAVKVLERANTDHAKLIDRELAVLRMLHHQNIVQIYDIFDSARETYVVMEYLAGGELLDMITENDHLSERNSKQVIREVLQAVQYLHARGIVHRDVKPENILCVNRAWPLRVKITDFGLSKFVGCAEDGSDRVMRSQCGTAYYLAPEIANNLAYAKPVDLWACGVVLYVMLAGKFPFYGDSDDKFMRRLRGGVKFPDKEWSGISADAKALVRGLLDPSPASRLTASESLQHRWLVDDSDPTASSMPTQAAGDARERRRMQYDAANEPLSLQLAQFSGRHGRARTAGASEFGESEGDILRTDDLGAGAFGGVPLPPTPNVNFVANTTMTQVLEMHAEV